MAVAHTASAIAMDSKTDQELGLLPGDGELAQPLQRRYTIFPGRNHFACDGRIMQGPDWGMLFTTICLLTIPGVLFMIFDLPWLATNVSVAVPIVFAVVYVFAFASLFATSFRDPGVLPRGHIPPPVEPSMSVRDELPANYPLATGALPPLVYHDFEVRGKVVKTKYCETCHIVRPPRSTHCRSCDCCIVFLALYVGAFAVYHFAMVLKTQNSGDASQDILAALSTAPTS